MMTKMHGRVELQRHDKFLFLLFFFNIPAWFCGVCLFIHLFCFCTGMLLCIQISKVLKRQNHARRHFTVCCMFSFPFLYPVLERLQCFSLVTYLIVMQSRNPLYGVISSDSIWWRRYGAVLVSFSFLCNTKHPLKITSLHFLYGQVRVFSVDTFRISIQEPFWVFEHIGKVDSNLIFKNTICNQRM